MALQIQNPNTIQSRDLASVLAVPNDNEASRPLSIVSHLTVGGAINISIWKVYSILRVPS